MRNILLFEIGIINHTVPSSLYVIGKIKVRHPGNCVGMQRTLRLDAVDSRSLMGAKANTHDLE